MHGPIMTSGKMTKSYKPFYLLVPDNMIADNNQHFFLLGKIRTSKKQKMQHMKHL